MADKTVELAKSLAYKVWSTVLSLAFLWLALSLILSFVKVMNASCGSRWGIERVLFINAHFFCSGG